jgi:hypothetical protein
MNRREKLHANIAAALAAQTQNDEDAHSASSRSVEVKIVSMLALMTAVAARWATPEFVFLLSFGLAIFTTGMHLTGRSS